MQSTPFTSLKKYHFNFLVYNKKLKNIEYPSYFIKKVSF